MIVAPDFGFGGAERSVAAIGLLLQQRHDLHTVIFNQKISQAYPMGGTVHSLEVPGGRSYLSKLVLFWRRVVRLRQLKRQLNPDVGLSFLEGADYVNVLSRHREKVVINIRGSKKFDPNITGWLGWIRLRILMPWLYSRADAFTSVSRGLQTELITLCKIPSTRLFRVIPNYYDCAELRRQGNEALPFDWETFLRERKAIVTVGRLAPEKGFDRFARVFQKLSDQENVVWLIVGDGPGRANLVDLLQKLKLPVSSGVQPDPSAKAFLLGYQANPHKWVKRATLFVLSSVTEGFPNALAEAMAVGTAVVATDCPYGPAEILTDEAGLLLPMVDDDSLGIWEQKMLHLLRDAKLRMIYAQKSIERARSFDPELIRQQWYDFLNEVTCGRRYW